MYHSRHSIRDLHNLHQPTVQSFLGMASQVGEIASADTHVVSSEGIWAGSRMSSSLALALSLALTLYI